jgi:hypothetical protein
MEMQIPPHFRVSVAKLHEFRSLSVTARKEEKKVWSKFKKREKDAVPRSMPGSDCPHCDRQQRSNKGNNDPTRDGNSSKERDEKNEGTRESGGERRERRVEQQRRNGGHIMLPTKPQAEKVFFYDSLGLAESAESEKAK